MRVHKTANFTVMSNYHFREKKMSLKAKGLLSLMLSLPEDWDYSVAGLTTLSKDGKDGVMTALAELEKFGYLTDAFRYGAPPHGGIGLGLDRLVMQMLRLETLRDVVAFPKVQNASEPMTDCPAFVDKEQLDVLGIGLTE